MQPQETGLRAMLCNYRIPFALLILAGITLFAPLVDGGTTHYPVFLIRLALIIAGAATLLAGMRQGEIAIPKDPHVFLAATLLLLASVSLIWAPYVSGALQWMLSLASYALFFVLLLRQIENRRHINLFVWVVCGVGIGEALLGIAQSVWLGLPRARGTFFNPNFFATYMGAIFSVALSILFFSAGSAKPLREQVLLWSTAGATGLAFVLAQSRGALPAVLCSIGVVGFVRFGKRFGLVLAVLLLGIMVFPNPIRQRAIDVSAHDPYAYTRLDIWASSLQRVIDHPLGAGAGMYQYTSFAYRFPLEQDVARYGKRAESAHNEYLQLAVELGVIGLLVVTAAIVLWVMRIRTVLQQSREPWERGVVTGLAAGTAGVLIHAAVDSVFHEPALMLLLVLMGSLVVTMKSRPDGAPIYTRIPVSYRPMQMVLVLTGAALAVVLVARPAVAWYAFQAGEKAHQAGQVSEALADFTRASLIDPGVTGYHDAIARMSVRMYEQSGNHLPLMAAIDELTIASSLNRQDARFPARLGMLHAALAQRSATAAERDGQFEKAATSFEAAIALDPYTPAHYCELAKIRLVQNHREAAKKLLQQAIAYEPNFLPARALLAELAVQAGETAVARMEYESIVSAQHKFSGRPLNALEREFLGVDAARVGRLVALPPAS